MKKLCGRTWFISLFILLLTGGMITLLFFTFRDGGQWATFSANKHLYTNGRISTGTLTDRNGVVLFDGTTGEYAEDSTTRKSTLHVVGDEYGNIATGGKLLFSSLMANYNPITGVSGKGNTVSLTIDSHINNVAYEALDGRRGAVGVYNYKTGEIVCLVSSPTFDPEKSAEVLAAVNAGDSSYDGVYLNHFLSSTFTPGSVFKIVTTAAAIEKMTALNTFAFDCTGSYEVGGDKVTCPSVHGEQNLKEALANSCNGAFADLAIQLGSSNLFDYAKSGGLLDSINVSGFSCAKGSFTVTDVPINIAWSGVGQYTDLVNPCAEMALMGAIACGGTTKTPTLLQGVKNGIGLPASFTSSAKYSIGWKEDTCKILTELMRNNVIDHYGQDQFGTLPVCAKSGTAEVGTENPHAWFSGFIADSRYPYAFVVLVENGGSGNKVAGSVAAKVLNELCGE